LVFTTTFLFANVIAMLFRRLFITACFLLAWLLQGASGAYEEQTSLEYKVKAAYLLNFTRYVEWPQAVFHASASPFVIGVLGTDPFGVILDKTVAERKSRGRPIEVRRITSAAEAKDCQVLFISSHEQQRHTYLMENFKNQPILIVGETETFLDQGGYIALIIDQGTVKFEVNLAAAERAGLRVSSRMLSLAKEVHR